MSADETRSTIPPEKWIPHPVSDHADLDRPDPAYGDGLSGDAKKEYDAAVAARTSTTEKPKRRRSRRKKPSA